MDPTPAPATHRPDPEPVADSVLGGLRDQLTEQGVVGVTVGWVDNNGIVRSRTVPTAELPAAARRGVGITAVFAVFDSHDGITFAHEGLSTPSGDVRLVPAMEAGVTPLAGEPGLAWVPGRQLTVDGESWLYDQRAVLERQVARAAEAGLEVRAGYEMEMVLALEPSPGESGRDVVMAHHGPAYGPNALREVGDFATRLLRDLDAHGITVGQLHAEYGESQLEIALPALDPVAAADAQVLARQTVHAAARATGLRASLAPVVTTDGAGNGWHLHTSVWRDGANALPGDGAHGLSDVGRGWLAGLHHHLHEVVAVTAPSTGSLLRRRPGFWAGAYDAWGVENREAALRLVRTGTLLGPDHANVELKASDSSANPYLALAVAIAAGLDGIERDLRLPDPVQEDPGAWDDARRAAAGVRALATTHEEQRPHLVGSDLLRDVLGPDLLGAFVACRDADAAWAADRSVEDVVAAQRWLY